MATRQSDQNEKAARSLIEAGWRQGSIFRPPADFHLDPRIAFKHEQEWLIVCTQSCSVCSMRFDADPVVEVAAATPQSKFNARSPEAKGKNARRLMLPLSGSDALSAIVCDVNRRTFIERRCFLQWRPNASIRLSESARKTFQGWLARYYTRIALPNSLVTRLATKGGLFDQVRAAMGSDQDNPLHLGIPGIYVRWKPDEEVSDTEVYTFSLLLACDDETTQRCITERLEDALQPFRAAGGSHGIFLANLDVETTDGITLKHANEYQRLSEWDELSELGSVTGNHVNVLMAARNG
jgi:hypothetical protein